MVIEARDAQVLAALATGETRSEALAAAVGMPVRSMRRALARLREAGLVKLTGHDWTPTGAGRRAALAPTIPEPPASLAILDALPPEHRAMLRLIEDAVIARRALRDVYPSNWPGFIAAGPTKSGKTLVGQLAARRFELDPDAATVDLTVAGESNLVGRLEQGPGRVWRRTASPLAWPLVILDEYDKAPAELRPVIFAYLAGRSRYSLGQEMIEVHATTIITLNTERDVARLLPDAYLRRAVVLDTTPLRDAVRDLDLVAAKLARATLPVVPADLAPPATDLPEDARRWLRGALRSCLTERGWELVDVEAIARLVLGRWAIVPADLLAAVLQVVADYLLVTSTREGLVRPDWVAQIEAVVGGAVTPIADTLAIARARQAAHEARQAATARTELDATMALAGERERLHDALDHALRSAPRRSDLTSSERAIIARARGAGRPLRDAISEARSLAALGELDQRLEADVLAPLRGVDADVERRREAAVQARAQQRQREADARRQAGERDRAARQAATAARRTARTRHAELQALYRRTRTQPGESVLEALLSARCLSRESEQYEEETLRSQLARSGPVRFVRRLTTPAAPAAPSPSPAPTPWAFTPPQPDAPASPDPAPVYQPKTRSWYEDRAGRRYQAGDLVAWGSPAVDAVLMAAATAEGLPPLTRPAPRRPPLRRP